MVAVNAVLNLTSFGSCAPGSTVLKHWCRVWPKITVRAETECRHQNTHTHTHTNTGEHGERAR